jgi:saccharopine dehydrogenase-like NADP-dependent oxidoreductase
VTADAAGDAAMKQILVAGAGKSASVLIEYLLEAAGERDWEVVVGDLSQERAEAAVAGHPRGTAVCLDAADDRLRSRYVKQADLVISLLPARLHLRLAEDCIRYRRHFVSASYVPPEMRALQGAAERAGVTLLNEMGVDPGLDHMSAMQRLDSLRSEGLPIDAFETFTGGLVAPQSDDNPWHYKLTWNPRNVVLAGRDGARFKHNGRYKYIPYHKLFTRFETLHVPGYGDFEGYANRDSLMYRAHYDLWDVGTIYRGTLRRPGFCRAWDCLVQLGLTDDSYEFEDTEALTYRDFLNAYLWFDPEMSVELKLRAYLKMDLNSPSFDKLQWLGLFEREPIGLNRATPARILQKRLEEKWALGPEDRDMVVMIHRVVYEEDGRRWQEQSSMVTIGEAPPQTAMARTVGLPVGIGAKLLLQNTITRRGVVIPTSADVYAPVLDELRQHGISFTHQRQELNSRYIP